MDAWIEESFNPVGQADDGSDLYGYVCLLLQNDQETEDFLRFIEDHGIEVDWNN